jgi:hypothetical protein
MTTSRIHNHAAVFCCAMALVLQISPARASDQRDNDHHNRPVDVTFTKWGAPAPAVPPTPFLGLFEGFSNDGDVGSFVAEVLWRQASVNGHVTGLEALYEVVDGDRSFSALIRGGQNAAGAALLEGVILAGWRTGARVQVEFQRYLAIPGAPSCDGAPLNKKRPSRRSAPGSATGCA